MIKYDFRPPNYFEGSSPNILLVKLIYPESQWGEEISIYANVMDGVIYYEAVDFYGNEFKLDPEKSTQPLTLQELILMIETMDVDPDYGQGNVDLTLSGIPDANSLVYPELQEYFLEKRKFYKLN